MLKIGKTYLEKAEGKTRLCADVSINNRGTTLWFAVDSNYEDHLALGRSDAFVMTLLIAAMRRGHEIVCEDPMSERLHYQLTSDLIPTLAFAGEVYRPVKITAPLTAEGIPNQGAVGTGFSAGADCLYTIMSHGKDSELPLTHIAVFNNGHMGNGYMWGKNVFKTTCEYAQRFAEDQGLKMIALDSNIRDELGERFLDVYSFRNYGCALALGRLFSVYLLSSGHDAANFEFDLSNTATFDMLNARYASAESLTFYHAGEEVTRVEKLIALSDWEPSWKWLHPCISKPVDELNCGHCRKCTRDMTVFYALGKLDRYKAVYNTEDYLRNLPQRLGVLLAYSDRHLYDEPFQLLKEKNIPIPRKAYVYERQFRKAMENLEAQTEREQRAENK